LVTSGSKKHQILSPSVVFGKTAAYLHLWKFPGDLQQAQELSQMKRDKRRDLRSSTPHSPLLSHASTLDLRTAVWTSCETMDIPGIVSEAVLKPSTFDAQNSTPVKG
jgi:hypothetical protein